MKILQRYILKEATTYFLICVFAFTGVLLTARILKFTNLIVNKGVALSDIALVFLSIIPTFLEIAVPMATLLGLMLAFARLSGDSEIVVLRASGISLTQLIKPVLVFGFLTTLLSLYISLELRPWGYQSLKSTLYRIAQNKTTAGLDAGIFNELGKLTLYMESIDHSSGELQHTMVDDQRNPEERRIIFSRSGRIISDTENQSILFELYDGEIHEETKSGYSITSFDSNFINLKSEDLLEPENEKRAKRFREETTSQLIQYNQTLNAFFDHHPDPDENIEDLPEYLENVKPDRWKKQHRGLKVELARRFSIPCASLLLGLIAMPLGIQPPRMQKTWGASLSIFLGVLTFALYFGMMSIGAALGEGGTVPPFLGTWLPNIAVAILAYVFIKKMGSEKWQSIAHGVETVFLLFRNATFGRIRQ